MDYLRKLSKTPRFLFMVSAVVLLATSSAQVINPNCQEKCGDVTIPYPFGTKQGCYYSTDFWIPCNDTFTPPKAFFGNIEVLNITVEGQLRVLLAIAKDCYNTSGRDLVLSNNATTTLPRFPFSNTRNKFIAVGCDTYAGIIGFETGCLSLCDDENNVTDGSCSGIGCCQTWIPEGMLSYDVQVLSFNNHSEILDFNPCSYAFLAEEDLFVFNKSNLLDFNQTYYPVVLDWAVGKANCSVAEKISSTFACKASNSACYHSDNGPGYRCNCSEGYAGNPYLSNGCKDIDECANPMLNNCKELYCVNMLGGYTCQCPKGYNGSGTDEEGCLSNDDQSFMIKVLVGAMSGFLVLVIFIGFSYLVYKKRKFLELKEKYFKQNGGFMLQQELSTRQGHTDTAKIYTAEELKKATNNYDENRIIGKGGYGTVYKGILSHDNRVVAIKKSKLVDQSQIEQFINEVVVLSQINHRNVVRLLGCCLETEVPLLVYEFVSNGTLYEHIHEEKKTVKPMNWETRLRIAAETAGVLSYLHSAASIPIIHRDVKSTNILLDENYIAKVSDFGASRLVPQDQTELSTMVQGTFGYLDPEYLLTSQLTEKSDVYSFGVVLIELLSGKMPLSFNRPEAERSLANHFLASLKDDCLFEIIDIGVAREGNHEQLKEVANLAKRCLKVKGEERPTMKEVAMELEGLRVMMVNESWVNEKTVSEETRSLLEKGFSSENFEGDGGVANTSIVYDTMRNHVELSARDGR